MGVHTDVSGHGTVVQCGLLITCVAHATAGMLTSVSPQHVSKVCAVIVVMTSLDERML